MVPRYASFTLAELYLHHFLSWAILPSPSLVPSHLWSLAWSQNLPGYLAPSLHPPPWPHEHLPCQNSQGFLYTHSAVLSIKALVAHNSDHSFHLHLPFPLVHQLPCLHLPKSYLSLASLGFPWPPAPQLVYLSTGFIDRGYARVCSSMHSTPELVPKALRAHKNQAATVPEVTDISSLCSFNTYHLASFCLLDNDKQHYLLTKCPRPCSIKCLHWHTLYHPTSYLPLPCLNPSYCHSWITFVCWEGCLLSL